MNARDKELAEQAGFNSFDTECYEGLDVLIDLIRADEREAIAKFIKPNEEHRRDASWGYIGGDEGVELLDNVAENILAGKHT